MSTTTIRLSKELKDQVARAAERAGKTPHGFILEAIAEKAELEDRRAAFIETAEQRYAGVAASGKTVAWSEMRRYLERRISGSPASRPKPRRLAR
jgi:predicted transcriptional regulator